MKVFTLLIELDKIFYNVYKEKMIDIVFGIIVNLKYGETPVQKHVKLFCKLFSEECGKHQIYVKSVFFYLSSLISENQKKLLKVGVKSDEEDIKLYSLQRKIKISLFTFLSNDL